MEDTKVLLNKNISDEERYASANNIIIIHNLPLNVDQIMIAFEKIRNWICLNANINDFMTNRLFLLGNVLNVNKNMYIAIILALCDNFSPSNLALFIIFKKKVPNNVGINKLWSASAILGYKTLLNYYEFDVSNISMIPEKDKEAIQTYRAEKYSCKLTKCAIKNE